MLLLTYWELNENMPEPQLFTGMTLRRQVVKMGNKVMLTTAPSPRSSDGKMVVRTLIFEEVD